MKTQFLKESGEMTKELKKGLVGKTIKNVEVLKYGGDVYIKLATDKGPIVIGANDL
jgi:ribosomal protein S3